MHRKKPKTICSNRDVNPRRSILIDKCWNIAPPVHPEGNGGVGRRGCRMEEQEHWIPRHRHLPHPHEPLLAARDDVQKQNVLFCLVGCAAERVHVTTSFCLHTALHSGCCVTPREVGGGNLREMRRKNTDLLTILTFACFLSVSNTKGRRPSSKGNYPLP